MERLVSDVELFLKNTLGQESSVKFVNHSEQGTYCSTGEIFFVQLSNNSKIYNLVIKCGNQEPNYRKSLPMQLLFQSEIHFYETILPSFNNFQKRKGIENPSTISVAQYYASFLSDNKEMIVLDDMKAQGYFLNDHKKGLPTRHLKLLLKEFAKLHAVSAAMHNQEPEEFQKLLNGVLNLLPKLDETMDIVKLFRDPVVEIGEWLKDDLNEEQKKQLELLQGQVRYIVTELLRDTSHFSTICHGDCWNNNFLFLDKEDESKVAVIDWQVMRFCSPVTDVSLLLYNCISADDLPKFDEFLNLYYSYFSTYLKQLGSEPEELFTFSQLLKDWKKFGRYGLMVAFLNAKNAFGNKTKKLSKDDSFIELFSFEINVEERLKIQIMSLLDHAIERDIFTPQFISCKENLN